MHQSRGSLRFHAELGNKAGVIRKLLLEHLDGNESVQFMVFCPVDDRHASGPDFLKNLISVRNQHSDLNHANSPVLRNDTPPAGKYS